MIELKTRIIHLLGGYTAEEWVANDRDYEDQIDRVIADMSDRIKAINNQHAEQLKAAISATQTPEGCKRGAWCANCAFGKKFTARVGNSHNGTSYSTYACTKDGSCGHFTRKEEDLA